MVVLILKGRDRVITNDEKIIIGELSREGWQHLGFDSDSDSMIHVNWIESEI